MGYTTRFSGRFTLDRELEVLHHAELLSMTDIRYNPDTHPGRWCQWIPSEDRKGIEWDGGEKFYNYTKWLEYLVESYLKPWGYVLVGEVKWWGEEDYDSGTIYCTNNVVEAVADKSRCADKDE